MTAAVVALAPVRHPRGQFRGSMLARLTLALVLLGGLSLGVLTADAEAKGAAKKTAAAPKPAASGDVVLARLGNTTVTRAEYEARLADLPPQYKGQFTTPEQKRQFVDRLLEEKVWLEIALRAKVDQRPEVQKQLANTRRDLLIRTYLGEAMQKAPPPSDSLVQAYYDGHLPEFMIEEQVTVRQIQAADEKTAKKVQQLLAKGGDFAALAKQYSTDGVTKEKGGDLGPVSKSGFFGSLGRQQALADTAFASPLNTVIGPIKTALGWHLIEVTGKTPAHAKALDEVKPMIARQLTQQTNQDFYQQSLAQAKSELKLKVDSTAVSDAVNAKKAPVDMFRDAGEVPNVDDRIRAYQEVVAAYPTSEYAPQALFMVGFVESEEKRDYDQAEKAFKDLIARYPSSELVSSAQWMIENMRSDKTPEFDLPGDLGKASEHDAGQHPNPVQVDPQPK